MKGSNTGNAALDYPIGLISGDEAMLAGILWNSSNQNSYLYTGFYYLTMTPSHISSRTAYVFTVYSNGGFYSFYVGDPSSGVRPVINLRSDIQITGSGTTSDPFKLSVE